MSDIKNYKPDPYPASRMQYITDITDPLRVIKEVRIEDDCITAIAKELKVNPDLVRAIHDHQWRSVKKAVDENKQVKVSKFCNLKLFDRRCISYINGKEGLLAQIEALKERIENSVSTRQKNEFTEKIVLLQTEINQIEKAIGKKYKTDEKI